MGHELRMPKYHCPYCSPRYQIHKERSDELKICGQCGDPLVKVPPIKATQIFAFITAFAFITPLIMTLFAFIQDLKRTQPQRNIQAMTVVFTERSDFANSFRRRQ